MRMRGLRVGFWLVLLLVSVTQSSQTPVFHFDDPRFAGWQIQQEQSDSELHFVALGSPVVVLTPEADFSSLAAVFEKLLAPAFRHSAVSLELQQVHKVLGRDYLRFAQVVQNLPLETTYLELRLAKGQLLMLRAHLALDAPESATPVSTQKAAPVIVAQLSAEGYLLEDGSQTRLQRLAPKLWESRLIVSAFREDPLSRIEVQLSADGTQILDRREILENLSGSVHGDVQELTPWGPYHDHLYAGLHVSTESQTVATDANGNFELEISGQQNVSIEFRGNYLRVLNESGAESSQSQLAQNSDQLEFYWDDSNSWRAERNTLYHARQAHSYLKELEAGFSGLDFVTTFHVRDESDHCNGFWAGQNIYLFAAGEGCADYGEIADVIVHEYGHGLSYAQYGSAYPNGTATAEAMSDIFAAYVTGSSFMGAGATGPGSWGRNLNNNLVWPDDLVGQIHMDGRILGGIFWDLREELGASTADTLFHFCKYGHPEAFDEFLTEVLLVDDDDNNLSNGTPHGASIHEIFGSHGIGSGLLPTLDHTPLNDTANTQQPYQVFVRPQPSAFGLLTDSLLLHVDTGAGWLENAFTLFAEPNVWLSEIPAQTTGSLVRYYITAIDSIGQRVTVPEAGSLHPHFFLVGQPLMIFNDNFETDQGWETNLPTDDANSGLWERVIPVGTWVGDRAIQPAADHSLSGEYCWITGNASPGDAAGVNDVDAGCTSLLSPPISVAHLSHTVLSCYRWWVDDTAQDDQLLIQISDDGGSDWTTLESVGATENSWTLKRWLLDEYVPAAEEIRLKFTACDTGAGSLVEAALDDLRIYASDSLAVGLGKEQASPEFFQLSAPFPNPSNGSSWILFELARSARVGISLYNIRGERILQQAVRPMAAGNYRQQLDTEQLATGIYILSLTIDGQAHNQKLLRIK